MKNVIKFSSIILALVILDQLTKGIMLYLLTGGVPVSGAAWDIVPVPYMVERVTNFFNIVFTWNPGASFSLFRAIGENSQFIIIFATSLIIGFLGYHLFCNTKSHEKLPFALIIGGALGNLVDRFRFGAVIDFLDFHVGGLHWPAFNIADVCIAVGVGLYVLNLIIKRNK